MSESLPIVKRAGEPADVPFLINSWIKSYWDGGVTLRYVDRVSYFASHHRIIEAVLSRPETAVTVIHPEGEPRVIVAYLVQGPGVVHYVYVKNAFRHLGLARTLIGDVNKDIGAVTHLTTKAERILSKNGIHYRFNPY
jgi:hypothetical protein